METKIPGVVEPAGAWGPLAAALLAPLPRGSALVAGSMALGRGPRGSDVDVFVADPAVFARLLHGSPGTGVHPNLVPGGPGALSGLEGRMSFAQLCLAADPHTGRVLVGSSWRSGRELAFNPASRLSFPDLRAVSALAGKLAGRGYALPKREVYLARAVLGMEPGWLGHWAFEAAGRGAMTAAAACGAVLAGGCFRSALMGEPPKDFDVFCVERGSYEQLCRMMLTIGKEVEFDHPPRERINLRKFDVGGRLFDVIDYGLVQRPEHVVETFDFSANMLWLDPRTGEVRGSGEYPAGEVMLHVLERKLRVGRNMWYRAGAARSLKRWQKFTTVMGFAPDDDAVKRYGAYVRRAIK